MLYYCKGTKGAYHGGIPALSGKIEKAEKKFQDVKKVGDDKKIREAEKVLRSLEGELKYANQWIKDATPSDVKVNYMEFELEDQFRCNGSNNYIDWLPVKNGEALLCVSENMENLEGNMCHKT